jgi:D-alanyl-D-alanine carboxypeptidase
VSASLETLIPDLQAPAKALLDLATRAGVSPRITSTLRSHSAQARLYRRFQAGQSAYPVAPPGLSAHEYGYAFDMVVIGPANQADLGQVWESWGGVYGGAADPIHFEYPGFHLPTGKQASSAGCSALESVLAGAVDLILGFAPGIGQVELVSSLLSLGFRRSEVLKFLSNPVSYSFCRPS